MPAIPGETGRRHAHYPDVDPAAVRIAGVLVSVYIKDGALCLSADLEAADPGLYPEGAVPVKLFVQAARLYAIDGTGKELT